MTWICLKEYLIKQTNNNDKPLLSVLNIVACLGNFHGIFLPCLPLLYSCLPVLVRQYLLNICYLPGNGLHNEDRKMRTPGLKRPPGRKVHTDTTRTSIDKRSHSQNKAQSTLGGPRGDTLS